MAIPLTNLNGHLTRIMTDIPVAFVWNGINYIGIRTTLDISETPQLGGFDEIIEFILSCKSDIFTGPKPTVGAFFAIGGVLYRVLHVKPSPDAANLLTFMMGFARQPGKTYE